MKIGIDARCLTDKKTGIGYYVNDLLKTILKHDSKNEYYLISCKEICFKDIDEYSNLNVIEDKNFKGKQTVWYYFYSHKLVNKLNLDIYWATSHTFPLFLSKNIKKILTIHDMVSYEFPETMQTSNRWISDLFIPNSIKKANKIIAVSESTRNGIYKHFNRIDKNKVIVSLEAFSNFSNLDSENQISNVSDKMKSLDNEVFILYVGTIEPRKNLEVLINAHAKLYNKFNMKLVICGKLGWKSDKIKRIINDVSNKDKIYYFDYVKDEEKFYLMKKCFAFIFPSLYEGFGLPIVEAMNFGTLTLAANNSSLIEVVGNDELLFDTYNSDDLADKLIDFYQNNKKYNRLKEYCSNRAKDFSWDKSARDYIDIFNNL